MGTDAMGNTFFVKDDLSDLNIGKIMEILYAGGWYDDGSSD